MEGAVVLNVCKRPYAYVVNVAANHGIEPDAAALPDDNVSYNAGARGYKNVSGNPGHDVSIGKCANRFIHLFSFSRLSCFRSRISAMADAVYFTNSWNCSGASLPLAGLGTESGRMREKGAFCRSRFGDTSNSGSKVSKKYLS